MERYSIAFRRPGQGYLNGFLNGFCCMNGFMYLFGNSSVTDFFGNNIF